MTKMMTIRFNYEIISAKDVQDMLFLIAAHSSKSESMRFNKLLFEQKQKVTWILRKRARRARNHEQPIDKFIVREVLDDAQRNKFYYE